MYNVQSITAASRLLGHLLVAFAIVAVAMTFVAAGSAQAQPKETGPAKGCLIENNGKFETVPVGTRIGLFVCGSDGEWHFGWLITGLVGPPHKTVKPVVSTTIQRGVLRAARAYR